ncbi:MAG: imidazole glycerol phosphate synthase subunit HisH [Deltaproteobacteria bacterium]|nr:imidazole glycerol phosphate synthase subunit HisH [Deltaproteobacteria bacterium]MBW1919721.1 imidazole glycerol phosphate synthase subunit HisH [Deltaproteobacteria bacterium]MBW1936310.1 imidazole glycerol phosphate synthase subunit HisH [Deltaproteobacteria bacterium]MBW1979065.1 imidazole glycerol phosphate synthase subunit HisH [Deltaproteobacteria bacterium]MBW2045807.1 imidazole glycerol phosphate synthase subunit HisH [Deltaproteobacteria bacterium]
MIAIVDYEAGNLTSVQRALNFLGYESFITAEPSRVADAERVIFPGVGAAGKAMADLKSRKLDLALQEAFRSGKPFLGICLGTQIIMEWSEENNTSCLGLIKGKVRRFPEDLADQNGNKLKVPHMGWNGVHIKRAHPLFEGVSPSSEFYFVHAYYPAPATGTTVLGETFYGLTFASVICSGNLVAVQFHPEKSGRPGLRILANFCQWKGSEDA